MDKLLDIINFILLKRSSPKKIKRIIKRLKIRSSSNLKNIDHKAITVGSAQVEICVFTSLKKYIKNMNKHMQNAVTNGAQLVVFPELNGLLLLGMIPFIKIILSIITNFKGLSDAEKQALNESRQKSDPINIIRVMEKLNPFLERTFTTVFSCLAKEYKVYIMSGSNFVWENGKVYNRNYFFAPNGMLIEHQDKIHLTEMEQNLGLSTGDHFKIVNLDIGKIGFPVCMDATYFETFKILKSLGAQIVLIPIADMQEYITHYAMRGIWPRVQESGIYGVKSALVGNLYGFKFTGKSGVFAPISLTDDNTGVVTVSKSFDKAETLVQALDLTLLDSVDDLYIPKSNTDFNKRYFKEIYKNFHNESTKIKTS